MLEGCLGSERGVQGDKSQGRLNDALPDLPLGAEFRGQPDSISPVQIKSRCYTAAAFPKHQKDIDSEYCRMVLLRLDSESCPLFARASIEYHTSADLLAPTTVPAVANASLQNHHQTPSASHPW